MRVSKVAIAAAAIAAAIGRAQVLAPAEIREPALKALQAKDLASLRTIANAITGHYFPYHFYCSRALDIEERQQQESDQRSIRFATYRQRTVLQITGNYFASYPGTVMVADQRAERTLKDVITPIVQAAIPAMSEEPKVEALALEVSHHVRRDVLGVTVETPENVAYFLPRAAWASVAGARTEAEREAALMQGALFVNGNPVDGWERQAEAWAPEPKTLAKTKKGRGRNADDSVPEVALGSMAAVPAVPAGVQPGTLAVAAKPGARPVDMTALTGAAPANEVVGPAAAPAPVMPAAPPPSAVPSAPASPAVAVRPAVSEQTLAALVHDLDKDAHFVAYAPPEFMTFHGGSYLQLSFNTTLKEREAGSQYREAALAFD